MPSTCDARYSTSRTLTQRCYARCRYTTNTITWQVHLVYLAFNHNPLHVGHFHTSFALLLLLNREYINNRCTVINGVPMYTRSRVSTCSTNSIFFIVPSPEPNQTLKGLLHHLVENIEMPFAPLTTLRLSAPYPRLPPFSSLSMYSNTFSVEDRK